MHMARVNYLYLGMPFARLSRHQGYDVLQPIGWDWFGLPAEEAAAIRRSADPRESGRTTTSHSSVRASARRADSRSTGRAC